MTDHRIGFNASDLPGIMSGEHFERLVDAMKKDFAKRRLEAILAGEDDLDE